MPFSLKIWRVKGEALEYESDGYVPTREQTQAIQCRLKKDH